MNDDESAKIDKILSDVQQTKTKVEVIDERTQHMESRMDGLRHDVGENAADIDTIQADVKRNKTILGAVGTAITAAVLWLSEKATQII